MTDQPHTQFVNADSLRLAYCEWPAAPGAAPILCLPHLTGHKGSFASLARQLSPRWRLLALDLPGRGESDAPGPKAPAGFAQHARDVLALAGALGLEQFILLGHSYGATAAVYLAATQPDRVRALALLDGGADPRAETLRAMYAIIDQLEQPYPTLDAYLAAQRARPFYQPWSAALEQYLRADVTSGPDGAFRSCASAPAIRRDLDRHLRESLWPRLAAVRCPALFIRPGNGLAGARGHLYSEAEAQALVASLPNAVRVDVPGVNHYTMLIHDDPPPATEPIRAFLEKL